MARTALEDIVVISTTGRKGSGKGQLLILAEVVPRLLDRLERTNAFFRQERNMPSEGENGEWTDMR